MFRIRLVSAQFPKDKQLGSTEVFILFKNGEQNNSILGNGYNFESEQINRTFVFDDIDSQTLEIYASHNQSTPDNGVKVYGQVHLKQLKSEPKNKHIVRVFCVLKQGNKITQQEVGVIDLQIIYQQQMTGILEITIQSANLTRDTQIIGQMDPYAKLIMGQSIHRTTVKKQAGKTPIWNQKFVFEVTTTDARLEIQIKDQDVTKNDMVGLNQIRLKEEGFFGCTEHLVGRAIPIYYNKQIAGTVNILTRFTFK